ncbi:Swi3-domain-containing protein [Peniophora sp. CONT]|nr:Swi3-domain-containing protein [Peniophora sp. CONT]
MLNATRRVLFPATAHTPMSAELDSIWDLPTENASSSRPEPERAISVESDGPSTRPAKRPLFLPGDSDEEEAARSPRRSSPPRASAAPDDIDAMFEGLDEIEDRPALDLDRVRREADARNSAAARAKYAVNVGSTQGVSQAQTKKGKERMTTGKESDEEKDENGKKKKQKKVRAKLDENRLLGELGFPQLMKDTKYFVPKGKGQEAKDLDRVMELYRMWAHRMWPKDKFKDTVQRVEKLCHSRRMHNALSQFHDEAKGLVNGQKPDVDVDLTSDAEGSDRSRSSSPAPAPNPNRVIELDDDGDIFGTGTGASTRSFSRAPTQEPPSSNPPSSPSSGPEENFDDMDLDAILAADEAAKNDVEFIEARAPKPPPPPADDFDDDAMWDALDEAQAAAPKPAPPPQPKPQAPSHDEFDDDEDMWDAVREVEARPAPAPAANKPNSADTRRRAEEEEMESMYA